MSAHPLWARTPLVLRRWPDLLAAMVVGAMLLGIVAASTPLFLSASGTDALAGAMRNTSRFGAGLSLAFRDALRVRPPGGGPLETTLDARDELFDSVVGSTPHLGRRVVTGLGEAVAVDSESPRPGGAQPVRLVYRTGALDHVERLAGSGSGAWIQDVTARSLNVEPGDEITLIGDEHHSIRLRVAGIYAALYNAPFNPFWEPLGEQFHRKAGDSPLPPPFVLVTRDAFVPLLEKLGQQEADWRWEYPVAVKEPLDLSAASEVARRLSAVTGRLLDPHEFGRTFICTLCPTSPGPIRLTVLYDIDQDIRKARETVAGLEPSLELLSVAGALVALVVLGAAGLYSVNRRRTEMRFLVARGLGPAALGGKAALESVLPCLAGAAIGLGASILLLSTFGPSAKLDPAGLLDAARALGVALPAALLAIGITSAAAVMKETSGSGPPSVLARIPWELPVLVVAGLALRRITTGSALVGGGDNGVAHTSSLAILFPVLFIAGAGGLAARAFKGLSKSLRTRLSRAGAAIYLAVNRLASAKRLAVMLITGSALAFGIFLYAQTMAASVRATTTAKSFVFTGSDVSVPVNEKYTVAPDFTFPYTKTTEAFDAGRWQPSNLRTDVLGIDPDTFERAAYWDESFSDRSLHDLVDGLTATGDGFLPVIVVGDQPPGSTLEFGGVEVPFRVVGRAESFPGKFLDRTLIVVDAATMGAPIEAAGGLNPLTVVGATSNLWIKGDPDAIDRGVSELGFGPDDTLAARDTLNQPAFVSVTRTFGFLKALGIGAALLVIVGMALYVQSRQRARALSYALARRMGLAPRAHYSALLLELGAMLVLSLVVGLALGGVAAAFVFGHIDLLPQIPPRPLLRIPLGVVAPIAVALVAVALAGAWRAHRSAEKADIAEALRSGA